VKLVAYLTCELKSAETVVCWEEVDMAGVENGHFVSEPAAPDGLVCAPVVTAPTADDDTFCWAAPKGGVDVVGVEATDWAEARWRAAAGDVEYCGAPRGGQPGPTVVGAGLGVPPTGNGALVGHA